MEDRPFPAYQGDERYFFVSYAHDEADIIYPEMAWIREAGFNLWYDDGIRIGDVWRQSLADALSGASGLIFFATKRSEESSNCLRELNYVLDEEKPVFVVRLDSSPLPSQLRLSLSDRQALVRSEFDEETYRSRLIAALSTVVLPDRAATPLTSLEEEATAPADPELTSYVRTLWNRRRPTLIVSTVILLIVASFSTYRLIDQAERERWARQEALPEIRRLTQQDNYRLAYPLAVEAERYISDDSILSELIAEISVTGSIVTEPAGAEVYYRVYDALNKPWIHLGQSPIDNLRIAKGTYRWKLERNGYDTLEFAYASWSDLPGQTTTLTLYEEDTHNPGMVEIVPLYGLNLELAGFNYMENRKKHWNSPAPSYFIDTFEVTNREFKEFVTHGGYENRDYWKNEFVENGISIPWKQAIDRFRDTTGRAGPSTWAGGSYPPGEENFPVTGVSWYEAAAYAESVGKKLPTIYHWIGAAEIRQADWAAKLGNFRGEGPVAVGSRQAMSPSGTHDMAGNVKEWCWSPTDAHDRYILGGAWIDDIYMFTYPEARPPFDRSAVNGFRTVVYPNEDPEDFLSRPIALPNRNYTAPDPVSDDVFRLYAQQYDYDPTPLDAVVELSDTESFEHWTKEKITFNAAYGNERLAAYLFLPKNVSPPYQTVIFFPGTGSIFESSSENLGPNFRGDFILMSGRAFVVPIYKSTYERQDDLAETWPDATRSFTDHVIMWVNDARRTIDYLMTREEIDASKLGYYGFSWGGRMGPIVLAMEPRLSVGILESGALSLRDARPEAHQAHFAPRVTVPVLMLNGKWDFLEPMDTAQLPLFDLLGTPDDHKEHIVFDASHSPLPRNQVIQASLAWLDKYLGLAE